MPEGTPYIQLGTPVRGLWRYSPFALLLMLLFHADLHGQSRIVITGAVLDADEHKPIPAVHVKLNGSPLGTSTDINGHFMIHMEKGDTLSFSSIGYANALFILPEAVDKEQYTLIQLLRKESLLLDEVIVFPWPEWTDFKKAFLKENDPAASKAPFNPVEIKKDYLKHGSPLTTYYFMQLRYQQLYDMNGIIPPNNFLNPLNWSNFIEDLRKKKINK